MELRKESTSIDIAIAEVAQNIVGKRNSLIDHDKPKIHAEDRFVDVNHAIATLRAELRTDTQLIIDRIEAKQDKMNEKLERVMAKLGVQ